MRKFLPAVWLSAFVAFTLLETAAVVTAQTVVNSTWLGGDGKYSNPANWSPAEVPNNTADHKYDVQVPLPLQPNIDATVSNLTLNNRFTLLGHAYAVEQQTTVNHVQSSEPGADLALEQGFTSAGPVPTSFQTATLQNNGVIEVNASQLIVTRALLNYDPLAKTLSGGSYSLAGFANNGTTTYGILSFPGADIVNNAATISLSAMQWKIVDENGNDALRNFVHNGPTGTLELFLTAAFSANSDFLNEGRVELLSGEAGHATISIPAGHVYRQTSGLTLLTAGRVDGDVEIDGGELTTMPGPFFRNSTTINGNLSIGDARFTPDTVAVSGSVQLSSGAHLHYVANNPSAVNAGVNVTGTLTLGGTFEVEYPSKFPPGSTTGFFVANAGTLTGSFANVAFNSRITTTDGAGSFVLGTQTHNGQQLIFLTDYQRAIPASQLINISTRAQVLTGDNAAIGGFIITGYEPMKVIIRAIGPSLAAAGVNGALQDPIVELHDSKGAVITTNDNWQDTQASDISATGLTPGDPRESAIVATLQPGSYTAVLRGKNDTTGVALVEVYDLANDAHAKLANISTRGFVDADHVLIGGTIAGGNGQGNAELVVRAIGNGLQYRGVKNFLADPALEVRDKDGTLVAANDDFSSPQSNFGTVPPELALSNPGDAATGVNVPTGKYTVVVHGKNGASGNALVEIYDLNR